MAPPTVTFRFQTQTGSADLTSLSMNENLSSFRAAAIMMQTGPVVTLHVAKSGASYHGLEALMTPPAPENTSSKTQM